MLYTFYFYDGVPTAERRPVEFPGEGVHVEKNLNFNSDADAIYFAADTVAENNDMDIEEEIEYPEDAEEYLDSLDWGDGSYICIAISEGDRFIYGDQETVDKFMMDENLNEDDDEFKDQMNEDFSDKIKEFDTLDKEINQLQKEAKDLDYKTKAQNRLFRFELKDLLDEKDVIRAEDLKKQIESLEEKISDLYDKERNIESRFGHYKDVWYQVGKDDYDRDIEWEVLDPELEKELQPEIDKLEKELDNLHAEKENIYNEYQKIINAAVKKQNEILDKERSEADLETKYSIINSKKDLNKARGDEILKEEGFENCKEFLESFLPGHVKDLTFGGLDKNNNLYAYATLEYEFDIEEDSDSEEPSVDEYEEGEKQEEYIQEELDAYSDDFEDEYPDSGHFKFDVDYVEVQTDAEYESDEDEDYEGNRYTVWYLYNPEAEATASIIITKLKD